MYINCQWFVITAFILGQINRYGCETVYGGPDHLGPGVNVSELTGVAKTELESCIFQYKGYHYKKEDILPRCLVAYNGLRHPPPLFAKIAKDATFGRVKPPTGFRIRQEVRTLTEEQRAEVFRVFQELYKRGITRQFGMVHNHGEMRTHAGAAFTLWHRIFILGMEEEMRKINPNVVLPYWDYTIDAELDRPEFSIVWSDCFFGNPYGPVTSGPYGNEIGRYGEIVVREVARYGNYIPLLNKGDMAWILNGTCHFREITTGKKSPPHNMEDFHGNVHFWVGGDFVTVPKSAFDLIFYMHHAFIDVIYQEFRNQQMNVSKCGHIDIENDYRPLDDVMADHQHHHGPDDPLPGWPFLTNKQVLWKNWTTEYYNYAPQPSCPDNCGGKYLYCDYSDTKRFPKGKCMTRTVFDQVECKQFKPVFKPPKPKEAAKAKEEHILEEIYLKD